MTTKMEPKVMVVPNNTPLSTAPPSPTMIDDDVDVSTADNNNNNCNTTDEESEATDPQVGGAAVVGGLVGLLLAGPVIALAMSVLLAVAATTRGRAGDAARASGDAVAAMGSRLHHVIRKNKIFKRASTKAKEFDEKHHLVEKTSKSIVAGSKYITKKMEGSPTTVPPITQQHR